MFEFLSTHRSSQRILHPSFTPSFPPSLPPSRPPPSFSPSFTPSLPHLDTLRHVGRVVRAELTVLLPNGRGRNRDHLGREGGREGRREG